MKKRILAFLLVCLMVVSMVPVTAFADEHQHSCPGAGEQHTLENCPDATVIEVVDPICGEDGYTIYQCPVCEDYFVDSFVQKAGEHVWEVIETGYAATCTKAGKTDKKQCSVCGKVEGGDPIPMLEHDLELKEEDVIDCVNGNYDLYVCKICGAEVKKPTGEGGGEGHTWGNAVLIKEPTLEEYGIARYTCTVCGQTKDVDIWFDHEHVLVHHSAVTPTCDNEGNIEYWECSICHTYFANAEGTEIIEDVTLAPAHQKSQLLRTERPSCTEIGYNWYHCNLCGEDWSEEIPATNHTFSTEPTVIPVTCTEWGFKFYACTACGYYDDAAMEKTPPTGHSAFEDDPNRSETPATCETDGQRSWTCTNDNCSAADNKVVEVIPATGHNLVTVKMAATCALYAYEYTYCANDGCTTYADTESVELGGKTYDVSIVVEGVKTAVNYVPDSLKVTGNQYDPNNHILEIRPINEPTCTTPGNSVEFCPNCSNYEVIKVVPALGHDYDITIVDNVTTVQEKDCVNDLIVKVKCSRCEVVSEEFTPEGGKATGHVSDGTPGVVIAPTCSADGYTQYHCSVCDNDYQTDIVEYQPRDEYTLDQAKKEHTGLEADEGREIYREGSCTLVGLYRYECTDCQEYVLVVIDGTGLGHVQPDWATLDPTETNTNPTKDNPVVLVIDDVEYECFQGVANTCETDGYGAQFFCEDCGQFIESVELKAPGHNWVVTPGFEETCTEPGKKDLAICQNDCCNLPDNTDPERDGSEIPAGHKLVKIAEDPATCYESGLTGYEYCERCDYKTEPEVIPALNHSNSTLVTTVAPGCETIGYQLWNCNDCGYEYMKEYKAVLGHDWAEDLEAYVAPTCEEEGKHVYVCTHDGSHTREDSIPATGHLNAAGEIFYNDCQDTTEDRYCVTCKQEIGHRHNDIFETYVPATCMEYGYTLVICRHGDYREVITDDSHLADHTYGEWVVEVEPTIKSEGSRYHICSVCGNKESEVMPAKEGIEYVINIDNAVMSGAGYADSSLIAVKVSLESLKTDVWGVRFNLSYNNSLVEFERAEFISERLITGCKANDNKEEGYVAVVANTANDADQNSTNITIEGSEEFVILYFRVITPDVTTITFGFSYTEALKNDDTVVYTEGFEKSVKTVKFLDINADGDVNLQDSLQTYQMITGELENKTYDVSVDVDKDGVITLTDFLYIYDYLVGSKSYDDMVALGR